MAKHFVARTWPGATKPCSLMLSFYNLSKNNFCIAMFLVIYSGIVRVYACMKQLVKNVLFEEKFVLSNVKVAGW